MIREGNLYTGGFCFCHHPWLRWKSREVLLVVCRTGWDRVVFGGERKALMGAKGVKVSRGRRKLQFEPNRSD
jgi:hypothetical protein